MEFVENLDNYEFLFKYIIVGTTNIGKTYLFERIKLNNNYFEFKNLQKEIEPTIAVDFKIFCLKYKKKTIKIQFWDSTGNRQRFQNHATRYIRGCSAILICYDAYNRNSFNDAITLYNELKSVYNYSIFVLIRNKYDLKINQENNDNDIDNDYVPDEEALEFADKNNIIFTHASSFEKYETGIKELLSFISIKYLERLISEGEQNEKAL